MRLCLIEGEHPTAPLAELLATRHEVTLIRVDGSDGGNLRRRGGA